MPTNINAIPIAMNIIDNTVNILTPPCCYQFLSQRGGVANQRRMK